MRTLNWKRLAAAGLVAAAIPAAMLWVTVRACGPDWEPEVFVPANHPERPALFAEGHLGVLQPGYYHEDLVVAYRILSGGKLSDAEKAVYGPAQRTDDNPYPWDEQRSQAATFATGTWLTARSVIDHGAESHVVAEVRATEQDIGNYKFQGEELNCTDGAFLTAAKTLQSRSQTWGAASPELKEWMSGQDAVFANCNGPATLPNPPQQQWKALLRQDRAYQIAAANFYAGNFDDAIAGFVAIGKDMSSPWSRWGEYLAARAEVRKASRTIKTADFSETAAFNDDGLRAAETRLDKIETETADPEIHHAAQTELNFILVRLDPSRRLDAAASALAGPNPDPDFAQDLTDLDWLMDKKRGGNSDLVVWIEAMQCTPPKNGTVDVQSIASRWREKQSLPWLVAALSRPPVNAGPDSDLLNAAANVKPDSPGYETVSYYRAKSIIIAGNNSEARSLADTVIARMGPETMASTRNAFLAERIQTAHTLNEFLADAPRTMIESGSEAANLAQCSGTEFGGGDRCTAKIPPLQFDADATYEFDNQLPLDMWQQAAASTSLPKNLRDAVAWAAWMRALGLGDAAAVKRLAPMLPEPAHKTSGDSDGFPATLALLRNPGLRPYLQQGVQRSATYSAMEELRDNWWCGNWTDGGGKGGYWGNQQPAQTTIHAGFLTAQQQQEAKDEVARLNALPDGTVWLGQRAIAYVKAHPDDKDAAEALGLTVRATHYSCSGQAADPVQKAVSKDAFDLLHSKYPKSEWALKTKYYY